MVRQGTAGDEQESYEGDWGEMKHLVIALKNSLEENIGLINFPVEEK